MKRLKSLRAKIKINLWYYSRKICGYLLFLLAVLFFGWLFDKLLETIFVILAYLATFSLVPKIKHFNTTQKCISVSTATFMFFVSIICIPDNVSIIWNILSGICIPIVMYIESLLFEPQTEKDKLIVLCKKHNYNELKTQMAIKFFVDKEKPKDVWLWLCETQENPLSWDYVKNLKSLMKKQLFTDK